MRTFSDIPALTYPIGIVAGMAVHLDCELLVTSRTMAVAGNCSRYGIPPRLEDDGTGAISSAGQGLDNVWVRCG